MSPHGHQGQAPGLVAQGVGHPGDGPGAATSDAYMPHMMDLEYTPGECPSSFPEPGLAEGTLEAGAFHEPPGGFTDPFNDNNHRV